MQTIFNDEIVRSKTVKILNVFGTQLLATQARKGEHLVSTMPAFKKTFDLMGVEIVDLSTENELLKTKKGHYDDKCLEESKAKLLKQIDDEKRAILFLSRMETETKKQY